MRAEHGWAAFDDRERYNRRPFLLAASVLVFLGLLLVLFMQPIPTMEMHDQVARLFRQFQGTIELDPASVVSASPGVGAGEASSGVVDLSTSLVDQKEGVEDWHRPRETNDGFLEISVWPRAPQRTPDPDEKFLSYIPHSGLHNQRISVANAMVLSLHLNRTLLLPPILAGWPVPRKRYNGLQDYWNKLVRQSPESFNVSRGEPAESYKFARYPDTTKEFPLPKKLQRRSDGRIQRRAESVAWQESQCKAHSPDCHRFAHDTVIAWDSVIDLPGIREETGLRTFDRLDMREQSVTKMLNIDDDDVLVIRDERAMDFLLSNKVDPEAPLISDPQDSPGQPRLVSLHQLARLDQRVLLFGTLHSTGKLVWAEGTRPAYDHDFFAKRMIFRQPMVVKAAREIADRLGGLDAYVALHARVTEWQFASGADGHMQGAWDKLVNRLGVSKQAAKRMKARIADESARSPTSKRALPGFSEDWSFWDEHLTEVGGQEKRSDDHDSKADTNLNRRQLPSIGCRRPLHEEPEFAPFNTPLYLATDARSPADEPVLQRFMISFPCLFTLADFETPDDLYPMQAVKDIRRLVNVHDGVHFGKRWISQVEATVVAMAAIAIGTAGSTFSAFAIHELHTAYHAS